jgi:predicted ATP-grasp superfamily ATP-dependent carboligase
LKRKVLVLSAGDPAGINFCKSLALQPDAFEICGADTDIYRLHLACADSRHLLPAPQDGRYLDALNHLIDRVEPDLLYAADTNPELLFVSENRDRINALLFMPPPEAVRSYENKFETYLACRDAGITVPETIMLNEPTDVDRSIREFGEVWIRATHGSGGSGSLPTSDKVLARAWVDRYSGWGRFSASQRLGRKMATWIGLWDNGRLITCQGRRRLHWEYAHLSPSGVSGITAAQATTNDAKINEVAQATIKAAGHVPHGIVAVDLTYDGNDIPNPTEIQASRFYTSIYFLARAGLNFPAQFVKAALGDALDGELTGQHPLRNDLVWLKTVDAEPILSTVDDVSSNLNRWKVVQ